MAIVLQLIALLTAALGGHATLIAAMGAGFGALLWLAGARYSRTVITLAGVGIGAVVGLRLPGMMHWPIDGIATAFAGAMLLGFVGLLLQTTFVGFALSAMLAVLFGAGAWALLAGDAGWTMPTLTEATS